MNKINKFFPAVSNLGRFRTAGSQLPQVAGPSGRVEINGNKYLLDGLVCRAFHGPPQVWSETVYHRDGNQSNNQIDNLSWGTVEVWKNIDWLPQIENRKRDYITDDANIQR